MQCLTFSHICMHLLFRPIITNLIVYLNVSILDKLNNMAIDTKYSKSISQVVKENIVPCDKKNIREQAQNLCIAS